MHLHIQSTYNGNESSCPIQSLCWFPQSNINEKVGWLVVTNVMGMAGITRTSLKDNIPKSYNLYTEHHKYHITQIRWNGITKKFVTCDDYGNICQWIPGKNNWIVGSTYKIICSQTSGTHIVVDMAWSHSGKILVVCYSNGLLSILEENEHETRRYIIVNSAFRRIFSCLTFDPDDKYILLGTLDGHFIAVDILDDNSTFQDITALHGESPVQCIAWNCPCFNTQETHHLWQNKEFILAIALKNGILILQTSFEDDYPIFVRTGLYNIAIQWNANGELIAAAGQKRLYKPCKSNNSTSANYFDPYTYYNAVSIFNKEGHKLAYTVITEGCSLLDSVYVTGIHWAHQDTCLFVSSGQQIQIVRVVQELINTDIPTLQQICCKKVCELLEKNKQYQSLILPPAVQNQLNYMLQPILNHPLSMYEKEDPLYCPYKDYFHCTLKKRTDEIYMLYIEFLGGLLPFLGAMKLFKRCTEFIIFDVRKLEVIAHISATLKKYSCTAQKISKTRQLLRAYKRNTKIQDLSGNNSSVTDIQEIDKTNILAVVTSNTWQTEFKIQKLLQKMESEVIGKVNYNTSVLHMVPRIINVELVNAEIQTCNEYRENNFVFEAVLPHKTIPVLTIDVSRDPIQMKYLTTLLPWTFCFDCKESVIVPMTDITCSECSLTFKHNWPSIFFGNTLTRRKFALISDENQDQSCKNESNIYLLQGLYIILINISNNSNHYTYTVFEKSFNEWEFYNKLLTKKNENKTHTHLSRNCKKLWESSTHTKLRCIYNDDQYFLSTGTHDFKKMWEELTQLMTIAACKLREDRSPNKLDDNEETLPASVKLQNKTPTWNKEQCIHQLECGGRVTVESEKNCQFEYNGKQILQFGRIGTSEFTLDFCRPFSPIQAFGVALTSLTHGMK